MSEDSLQLQLWHLRSGDISDPELRLGLPWLSKRELDYFRACRSRFRQRQFALGRLLLRGALSHLAPERSPVEWRFETGPHGRPALAAGEPLTGFSLAHSGDRIVLATGPLQRLGIDLENGHKPRNIERLARRWFQPEEVSEVMQLPAESRPEWFYRTWTIKEAWNKARGAALAPSLRQIVVRHAGNEADGKGFRVTLRNGGNSPWRFLVLRPDSGYHCALACESEAGARLVSRRMTGLARFEAMTIPILAEASARACAVGPDP